MIRTAPLTHVIRALASGLLVALLLEAAGLAIWAERLEVGMLRNVAQPVTQAWERVVTAVHLDLPRRAALELREHWSATLMPEAEAGTHANSAEERIAPVMTVEAPSSTVSTTAKTATTQQKTAADSTQKLTSPQTPATAQAQTLATPALPSVQVALVGDSMMAVGLAPVLRRTMATQSGVRFVRAYRSGTGLGRPDVFNWPEQYPQLIGAARPGLVICSIGANDAQNFQLDRTVYVFGTPAWKQVYADRVRQFARLLTRDGARVLWVGMPVMRENGFARRMASVNSLVKEVLTEFPQITWIDPNPYIAGEGGSFQQYLRDQRGKLVRLRADDGIHLSEDGAAYLVPPISGWMERTTKDNKGS
jgi:hypothetical protein